MQRLLLLIPTTSYRTRDFMRAASELGIEIVVGSDENQPLNGLLPDKTLSADFSDPIRGAKQISDFSDSYPIDKIVAVDDAGALLAANASELLRLSTNPISGIEATRNKALLRQKLASAQIPSPPFRIYRIDDDMEKIGNELLKRGMFPCVLKPLSLAGSRGVIRANDPRSFNSAAKRVATLLTQPDVVAECGLSANQFLVEGYIPGNEVALEGILNDGILHPLALFDKPDPLTGPFFEETIYVTPSRLPTETQRLVITRSEQAAAALNLQNGPIHVELRINEQGEWPIDIAARTIGGQCARSLQFANGASLEEIVLRQAIGLTIDTFEREEQASAVMMIPIPKAGFLKAIDGVEKAREIENITEINLTVRTGHKLIPLPEGGEYMGFIFSKAPSSIAAENAVRRAHKEIQFTITSESEARD